MESISTPTNEQKVAIANREARIAARRERIANRLLAESAQTAARAKAHGEEKEEICPGFSQLSTSLQNLSSLKKTLANEVDKVRGKVDDNEYQHRISETQRVEELRLQLKEANQSCEEQTSALSGKWNIIQSMAVPQELAEELSHQKQACDNILETKEKITQRLKEVLKLKTEEYNDAIHQQSKEVDTLIVAMGRQVISLSEAYIREFHAIENAFLVERQELISSKKMEVDVLIKKTRFLERELQENLYKLVDEYAEALNASRLQDSEDYNALKVKLESNLQVLEQHLESMQAAYQLNSEKLDYNYRVLVERDNDNYVTAGQQKRKLTKQRDSLCHLRGRHSDLEHRFKAQNTKLADEYSRVSNLLQDLQSKEQELQAGHELQLRNFFDMHQHALAVLVSKVLQADKVIHEQHLGWRWHPPSKEFFVKLGSASPPERKKIAENNDECEVNSPLDSLTLSANQIILDIVHDEAGFIIRDGVRKALDNYETCNKDYTEAISILHALGVTNGIEFDDFCKILTVKSHQLQGNLSSDNIITLLRDYLQEIENSRNKQTTPTLPEKKITRSTEDQMHWAEYMKIIDTTVIHVWIAFDVALQKYNQLLKDRISVSEQMASLRWQNDELRTLLKHCLESKAHEELHVPAIAVKVPNQGLAWKVADLAF